MENQTSDKAKIRRNISLVITDDQLAVRIAEHTGTQTGGDYEEIRAEVFDVNDLPASIQQQCMAHGLSQKLSDSTAGKSDDKGYSTKDRFDIIGGLYDQLLAGEWAKKSEGAGAKLSQTQIKNKMDELGLSEEQYKLAVQMGLIKA